MIDNVFMTICTMNLWRANQMILISIHKDTNSHKKQYSVESFHNNRYTNTGKMSEKAFDSYLKYLKPKQYIVKEVKNPRDLEPKIVYNQIINK